MKYVAMVVLLFTLGIILSTPVINNDEVTRASLIPTDYVTNTNSDLNDKIPELLLAQPNDTMCKSEITDNESTPKYCLVIASLATLEQAEKYIYLHENDVKGMFESDGRYRVYALTGPDQASVLSQELSERFPGAWPCKLNQ